MHMHAVSNTKDQSSVIGWRQTSVLRGTVDPQLETWPLNCVVILVAQQQSTTCASSVPQVQITAVAIVHFPIVLVLAVCLYNLVCYHRLLTSQCISKIHSSPHILTLGFIVQVPLLHHKVTPPPHLTSISPRFVPYHPTDNAILMNVT